VDRIADAVLETKVTYVRRLSHEVRTPLQIIMAGLQYILLRKRSDVSREVCDMLEEMQQACVDGMGILDDLLAYERLDAGTMTLDAEPVSVQELVKKSLRDFEGAAKLAEVVVDCLDETNGQQLVVSADKRKMVQVMRNMLTNALKFTPKEKGCIRVHVVHADSSVRIEVTDSGPGLDAEQRRRIVEETVRHDQRALLEDEQGYGMGVWLSRGIVELHGGHMGVESEGPGKGCTFFLELPVIKSGHPTPKGKPPSPLVSVAALATTKPITPHPMSVRHQSLRFTFASSDSDESDVAKESHIGEDLKILVVDDSLLCRKMVSRVLKDEGQLDEAVDGREATTLVLRSMAALEPYHLIVMDSAMPHTSGPVATEELRMQGYQGVIIGLTGNALPADVQTFLDKGANVVLLKPLDIGVLKRHVDEARRMLQRSESELK
jgi:CheY-like chemotaxis protein